jgi:hemolysin activation/secretion protein
VFGAVELRSPSITEAFGYKESEWRVYVFAEAGRLTIIEPLPEQTSEFDLVDFGIGSRAHLADHFNGSVDLGVPVLRVSQTGPYDLRLTFRVWAEF